LAFTLYLLVAEETLLSQTVGSSSPQHVSNSASPRIQSSSPQAEAPASPRIQPSSSQVEVPRQSFLLCLTARSPKTKQKLRTYRSLKQKSSKFKRKLKQLKTKLSALSNSQEADQKLLEDIKKMISDASNVISKYLGV
jgi:hypothetical protein